MTDRIVIVRTSEELATAVETLAAGGGGEVRLEAGRYSLNLRDPDGRVDAPVRITSADPSDPATFTRLRISQREDITVDGVVFDSSAVDTVQHHRDLDVSGSHGVTVADSVFRGVATETLDGTPGQERGAFMAVVRHSEGITFRDNDMSGYYHALSIHESEHVDILRNEITRMQGDGIRMSGVQDVLIEGNHLHSMLGSLHSINHDDMIQIWGNDTFQNTERVTIRDNLINTADGPSYQMIFGNNHHLARNGFLYEDVVVEGNLLYGANWHMISIAQTTGMVVRHNTVLWNRDSGAVREGGGHEDGTAGWVTFGGDEAAIVEGNVAAQVIGATGENGRVGYDDPEDAGFYGANFVNLDARGSADLRDLQMRAGSQWDGLMGAPMSWSTHAVDDLTATVTVDRVPGDRSAFTLDARASRDEDGALDGATYTWTFADGTTRSGAVVTHDFETPGVHDYALTVRAADGRTDRIERGVRVEDPDLLVLDLSDGALADSSSYATGVVAHGGGSGPEGFGLDGQSRIDVSRGASQLYALDSFGLKFDVTLEAGTNGTLVELWKSFVGRVDGAGRFVFEITTTEGAFELATAAGAVPTGQRAEMGVVLDGPSGELRLLIDGEVEARLAVSGSTLPKEHWGLTIGNLFGGHGVRGVLHEATMRSEPGLETGLSLVAGDGGSWDDDPAPYEPPEEALLLSLDFDEAVVDASDHRTGLVADEGSLRFETGSDGTGRAVALGGKSDGVATSRNNGHLYELDAFHVSFDLRREDLDDGGWILDLHRTLGLGIDRAGRLTFDLTTDEGSATVRTAHAVIADTGWHRVELAYDGAEGAMQLVVDGLLMGEAALTGTTPAEKYWGVALGRPWGGAADGWIDELRIHDEARLRAADAGTEAGGVASASRVSSSDGEGQRFASFAFDGSLEEADGRRVGVVAEGEVAFEAGRDGGRALRIGDDAQVTLTRGNAFLHERDAFEISFDLRKDDADGTGRVLHFHKAMEARIAGDELVFTLWTDEGAHTVRTSGGALGDDDWHSVEIGYDDASDRLVLEVDGRASEVEASGTTAEAVYWGLTLGAAWGDALEGAVDDFAMGSAPDWALG